MVVRHHPLLRGAAFPPPSFLAVLLSAACSLRLVGGAEFSTLILWVLLAVSGVRACVSGCRDPCLRIVAGPRRQEVCRSRGGAKAEPTLVLSRNQSSGQAGVWWSKRRLARVKGRYGFAGCGRRETIGIFALLFHTQFATQSRLDCLRRCRP